MKFSIFDTARTNNFKDAAIQEKIIGLWQRNALAIAQAKEQGKTIVAVYHEYESDYKGDYSVSIGTETETASVFDTADYRWKEYAVDASDEFGILNTWKQIWAEEDAQTLHRAYGFDYEAYTPTGEQAIFIGIL